MESTDVARFGACIGALALAYHTELDRATVELYFSALEDVPLHLLEAAAVELARSSNYFPKVAEWRRAVDTILDRGVALQGQKQIEGQTVTISPLTLEWRCPVCDNTGWEYITESCERRTCWESRTENPHTHLVTRRCTDPDCLRYRDDQRARRKRYAKAAEA